MFTGAYTNFANNGEMINIKGECTVNFFPRYPIDAHCTSGQYINDTIVICSGLTDLDHEGFFVKATKDCYQMKKGARSFETNPGKNK